MLKNNIYIDHPHQCNIVNYKGKKWRHKSVIDKKIQRSEFEIQNILCKSGYAPKCINYSDAGFLEEDIEGRTLSECDVVTDLMLKNLSETLHAIHKSLNSQDHPELFNGQERGWSYNATIITFLIVNGVEVDFKNNFKLDYKLIYKIAEKLNSQINKIVYEPSIIHGDVNMSNVILSSNGRIVIIDWTDCRIGVGVSDIAQAIHFMNLNLDQKYVILNSYKHSLNFPFFIQFQLLMHCLYDLFVKVRKNKVYEKELILFNKCLAETKIFL